MDLVNELKAYIIKEYLPDTPFEELEPSYDLLQSGVVDSLRLLQLISWVGERYGIAVDEIDIAPRDFSSIDAIQALIVRTREGSR